MDMCGEPGKVVGNGMRDDGQVWCMPTSGRPGVSLRPGIGRDPAGAILEGRKN
jgi:hypothetical protein